MKSDKILLLPFHLPLVNLKVLETVSDTQVVSNLLDFEITKVISMEDKKLQDDGVRIKIDSEAILNGREKNSALIY